MKKSLAIMVFPKFATYFDRHSGQAGESWREPESRTSEDHWIPFPLARE
jgi:hypothetical protein